MPLNGAPPKSILKKTHDPIILPSSSTSTTSLPIKPKSDAERKRLETAIQHARLIQEQKSILQANLNAIEELSEYPSSSHPTTAETSAFLTYLHSFQPSDYDSLVEERQVNNRCGYTLCANPPRKQDAKRPWLKAKGSELWCSDACAKRALYLKAQLDEVPAWERRAGVEPSLVLYDERKFQLPMRQKEEIAKEEQAGNDQRDLAIERGEVTKISDSKMDRVMNVEVLEKKVGGAVMPPTQTRFADSSVHDLIEGYQPRGVQKGKNISFKDESDDDDEDEEEDVENENEDDEDE